MDRTLKKALQKVGGARAMARALGISHQTISQWHRIPVERTMEIEKLTGIPRSVLRPDIYPPSRERQETP